MTTDRDFDRIAAAWLDLMPDKAPDRVVEAVLLAVAGAPQTRRHLVRVPWSSSRMNRLALIAAVAVLAAALLGGAMLIGGSRRSTTPIPTSAPAVLKVEPTAQSSGAPISPTPSVLASRTPTASPWPSSRPVPKAGVATFDAVAWNGTATPALQTLASSRFAMPVSLWLDAYGGDDSNAASMGSDYCAAQETDRMIVLPYLMGCVSDLRILLPSSVACGTVDRLPDAQTLAAAILANPGLKAKDLGPVATSSALPPDFLHGVDGGRVIEVHKDARRLDSTIIDPDHCSIDAGGTRVEVRGDLDAMLMILDVHGELVIIRLASGGYDGPSGSAASKRGYGIAGSSETFRAMLERTHEVSFGATAARP